MNIALLSDIHDHIPHLLAALDMAAGEGCERLFFMGDMARPETFSTLRGEWAGPIDLVFGNNESDRAAFLRMAEAFAQTEHHGDIADLEADGRRIAFTHTPRAAERLASDGLRDAVFFGHTHRPFQGTLLNTLLANPGEIQGRFEPCFSIYNTNTNTVRLIKIPRQIPRGIHQTI